MTANNPHIKLFNSGDHGYNIMKAVRTLPSPDNPNANGIREDDPEQTTAEVLRRFRVPAFGASFPPGSELWSSLTRRQTDA